MVGIETFMKSRSKIRKLKEGFGSLTFKDKDKEKEEKEKEKEKEGG